MKRGPCQVFKLICVIFPVVFLCKFLLIKEEGPFGLDRWFTLVGLKGIEWWCGLGVCVGVCVTNLLTGTFSDKLDQFVRRLLIGHTLL